MTRIMNIPHKASQTGVGEKVPAHWNGRVRVYAGDVATSTRPAIMHTLLGSCVAVCLYDPLLRAGGMNHILLSGTRLDDRSTRFGVNAMELLINDLMKHGGDRRRFVAKAFGGANVMQGLKIAAIGDDNATFVRDFLSAENIPLVAERLGGVQAVHVYFRTDSGRAIVQSVDGSRLPNIVRAEASYRRTHLADTELSGDITLF
jgi:chemotaxis protein CheD